MSRRCEHRHRVLTFTDSRRSLRGTRTCPNVPIDPIGSLDLLRASRAGNSPCPGVCDRGLDRAGHFQMAARSMRCFFDVQLRC